MKHNLFSLSILFFIVTVITFDSFAGISITVPSEGIKTITQALAKAKPGDTVRVTPGVYREHLELMSGVTLISTELFKAVIDGAGRKDVVTISYNCTIIGFEIANGNVGVVSRGPGNSIQKCRICKNKSSGILCTGNLPEIVNNVVVFNQGSGIQVIDVASAVSSINHNTIAYNGNNGIIYSGTGGITVENNIIVSNAGQSIKTQDTDKVKITHNILFGNRDFKLVIPENNFAFDPLFTAPKRKAMDFSLQKDSQAINKGNDTRNLGALLNY